jgi:hypothetical protein
MNAFREDDWSKEERRFQKKRILQFYREHYFHFEPRKTPPDDEDDASPIEVTAADNHCATSVLIF